MNGRIRRRSLALALIVFVASLGAGCTTLSHVPHGSGELPLYLGNAPVRGQEYRSLGAIKVTRGTIGFAMFFFDLDRVSVDARDIYVQSDDAGADMAEFLDARLRAEARRLGASAVINVRYGTYEIPVLLPLIGPLSYKRYYASGEAVSL